MKKITTIILIFILAYCNYSFSNTFDYNVYSENEYQKIKPYQTTEKIVFIVDFSNSMNEYIGGRRKIDVALIALNKILPQIQDTKQIGLRVYGHRIGITPIDACMASRLVVDVSYGSAKRIYDALEKIAPIGMTPITYSIKQSLKNDFGIWQGKKHLIILTDGGENCDESPCEYAMKLVKTNDNIKIDVIAFSLDNKEDIDQLRCAALVTKGKFYTAETYTELVKSLESAFETQKSVQGQIIEK